MITRRRLATFGLAAVLSFLALTGMADQGDLCSAFKGGKVDQSVLQTMLNAAEVGRLYRIEASSSKVGFCVESQFRRVEGDFREFQGGMALAKDGSGQAQALVAIKADSLDTDGSLVERMIKSARFFDVENYPEILFVSTRFEWTSRTTARLKGNLTLHGVTKPVTFHLQLTEINDGSAGGPYGDRILVKATTTVSRAEFGMDTLSALVDDTVQLCMSVKARKFPGKV
jgi:polyisoprenoid-binding protein YceI